MLDRQKELMRGIACAVSLLSLPFTLDWSASAQTINVITDPDAYAVYRAVVPKVTSSGKPIERIALLDETRFEECRPTNRSPSAEWLPVLRDFQAQNAATRTYMPTMLDLGVPVDLVPLATVTALLKSVGFGTPGVIRGGWGDAYVGFPDETLLTFSAVGFSPDKSRAMITVARDCGLSGGRRLSAGYDCHQFDTFGMENAQGRWVFARNPSSGGCSGIA